MLVSVRQNGRGGNKSYNSYKSKVRVSSERQTAGIELSEGEGGNYDLFDLFLLCRYAAVIGVSCVSFIYIRSRIRHVFLLPYSQ
jgi:hypothetical protein